MPMEDNQNEKLRIIKQLFLNNNAQYEEKVDFNKISLTDEEYRFLSDQEKIIYNLIKRVDDLTKAVTALKKHALTKDVPLELLKKHGIIKEEKKFKTGKGYRPILKEEILDAKRILAEKYGGEDKIAEAMVARFLGVSFTTYKRYAKHYNIFTPNKNSIRLYNKKSPEKGKYPLSEILDGKHPKCPAWIIRLKLFSSGLKFERCEICGTSDSRKEDKKSPLILTFADFNRQNHKLENLKIVCLNCAYIYSLIPREAINSIEPKNIEKRSYRYYKTESTNTTNTIFDEISTGLPDITESHCEQHQEHQEDAQDIKAQLNIISNENDMQNIMPGAYSKDI